MPVPIEVFSLADVLAKSDAAAMNRRQMQLADMKMQEYERGQQNETTLANMFAQQRPLPATLPGSPSVPAQPYRETNSPESAFGLPELQGNIATQAIPEGPAIPNPDNNPLGRLEHQSKQLRAMQQQLGERGAGKMAFELGQKADAIDEKLYQYRLLAAEKKSSGSEFTNYTAKVQEGASGRSDPLNVAGTLRSRLGREPTIKEIQQSYRSQLPDMYAPTAFAQGSLIQDRGDRSNATVRNPILIGKTERDELRDVSNTYESTRDLAKTFKPEYAGKGFEVLANASQWLASRRDDNSAQAQWARKYEALNNVERHKLFGSALTATELQSWNRSKASLAAGSGNMQTHLSNMERLAAKVLAKSARPLMVENYNQDSIKGALGEQTYNELKNTNLGSEQSVQSSVPSASERKVGATYDTPRGKLKWTGTGWVNP